MEDGVVPSRYEKSVLPLIVAVRDWAVFAIAGIWLKSPQSVTVYEEPAVTTSGVVEVWNVHVPELELDAKVARPSETMLLPLGSFNTKVLVNEDVAPAPPMVSFKLLSLASPAAFAVNVIEPI